MLKIKDVFRWFRILGFEALLEVERLYRNILGGLGGNGFKFGILCLVKVLSRRVFFFYRRFLK